ncbi:hypothetical protein TIFTF001_040550 [Ficus carica]|uniref:Uncharacterized protein n=1 Tax=Ficus carica TaxID=3494 RepID=A0AA87YXJ6_FICCA|nr:hypothetical protein TIFTF001_040550 [Ficus carica]
MIKTSYLFPSMKQESTCTGILKKQEQDQVRWQASLPVTYRPVQGRVGLWIELEMDWPPQPLHSCAPDNYVVLAERKLTSYVYAVGKQPVSNIQYKTVEMVLRTVKFGLVTATHYENLLYYVMLV